MANRNRVKLLIATLISCILTSCSTNYLELKKKVTTNERYNYAFYLDTWGIGDQGYYVLQLEKSVRPEDVYVEINMDGINTEQRDWMDKRTILFNYAEAGFDTGNPKIELIKNRHLVFSRGNIYYGLYDLLLEKDTFNIRSPWNEWRSKSGYKSEKHDRDKEEKLYSTWVRSNIHEEIKDYISANE